MVVQVLVMIVSSGWTMLTGLVIQDHVFGIVAIIFRIVILSLDYLMFSFKMVVLLPRKCFVTFHGIS